MSAEITLIKNKHHAGGMELLCTESVHAMLPAERAALYSIAIKKLQHEINEINRLEKGE